MSTIRGLAEHRWWTDEAWSIRRDCIEDIDPAAPQIITANKIDDNHY